MNLPSKILDRGYRAPAMLAVLVVLCGLAGWLMLHRKNGRVEQDLDALSVTPVTKPIPPPEGYVGSAACAECHADIATAYRSHPMSRSMARLPEAVPVETFDRNSSFRPGGRCVYEVRRQNGKIVHHEVMVDGSGQVIYDQAVPVQYAVGSGVRGRSYLIDRQGVIFMSPISWYSSVGWDLSPRYLPDDARRFDRRISDRCLACHAGRVAVQAGYQDRYQQPPFLELSIGCERCHGPGKEHVAVQSGAGPVDGQAIDSIVNPADLDPVRRESVCNQCHLQAKVKVPRYGRTEFDFRPGDSLETVWTVLVGGTGVTEWGTTKSVSHVQQMRASRCYQQSDRQLGCISCHDPHSVPAPEMKSEFYRARCMHCHAEKGCSLPMEKRRDNDIANSCIVCHMPRLETHDIAHTAQTDHRILRSPGPNGREGVAQGREESSSLTFFDGADRRMSRWEVDRAHALAEVMQFLQDGERSRLVEVEGLLERVSKVVPDDVVVLHALGIACLEQERFSESRAHFETALRFAPNFEVTLVGLLRACYRMKDYEAALDYAARLREVNPWYHQLYALQAEMLRTQGRLPDAIESAEKALQLNPRLFQVRAFMVETYEAAGREDSSRQQREILRRMNWPPSGRGSRSSGAAKAE